MDETTIQDIRQRVTRWKKDWNGKGSPVADHEAERAWCFAVNIDDAELLLGEIERLEKENTDLRLQLQQAREHQWIVGIDQACPDCDKSRFLLMDSKAQEPDNPTGLPTFWFEINTGPYQADDTAIQRSHPWSRGPFATWTEANDAWKKFLKRQKKNGQP